MLLKNSPRQAGSSHQKMVIYDFVDLLFFPKGKKYLKPSNLD